MKHKNTHCKILQCVIKIIIEYLDPLEYLVYLDPLLYLDLLYPLKSLFLHLPIFPFYQ